MNCDFKYSTNVLLNACIIPGVYKGKERLTKYKKSTVCAAKPPYKECFPGRIIYGDRGTGLTLTCLIPRLHWHRKASQHGMTRYGTDKFASVNKRQGVPNRAVPCWPDPLWSGGPARHGAVRHGTLLQCKQKLRAVPC